MINQAQLLGQLQRIQMLHQAGRIDEAWTAIAPMRGAIDGHGQGLRLYALVAQGAGRVDPAAEALRRIIAIEREPPEIVGALADMLGTASRHDDALTLWTRLTVLLPGNADAHLNRAISAGNAGKQEIAIAAADAGLKHFPGHARLLAVKAMSLQNAGRVDEALPVFDAAIAADPSRPLTRHNQAVALRAAHRFAEACAAFALSERLGMTGAQFHANWAAAALEAGQVHDARRLYEQALATDPTHSESAKALTRLSIEYRDGREAFDHYRRGADSATSPEACIRLANALLENGHHADAGEAADRALARFPDNPYLAMLKPYADALAGGDNGLAIERITRIVESGSPSPLNWLALLALRNGQPERAVHVCEKMIALDAGDQTAWSMLSIAWRLLDDPREHWLCDYERLVMIIDVESITDGGTAEAYASDIAQLLDPLHQALNAPGDQSLRGGTQTSGALFDRPECAIRQFRQAIVAAASQATLALPDDPSHPFLSRRSDNVRVVGSWSVKLRSGGHHVSHFHTDGWMSSAYYARLPTLSATARHAHAGWIQFGVPPATFNLNLSPRRLVEPREGRLVLFPSYMLHGTIPFSDGDRLTAAFDFQPD